MSREELRTVRAITVRETLAFGPFSSSSLSELLDHAPSRWYRWYLTGLLAPQADRDTEDPTDDEDLASATDDGGENEPAA